jgi:hypothetical protein
MIDATDPVVGRSTDHKMPDYLLIAIVLLFALLSFSASRQESVTIDEFRHLSTGVYYWQSGDYSFDRATPPLWKMAMALPAYLAGAKTVQFYPLPEISAGWEPWFVATDFMRDNADAYTGYLQSARLVNILAAAACLVILYCRCRRSFGSAAALFGTAFIAFSPTFLAHSHYATTDVIATLTLMSVVFLLIDYRLKPGAGRLASAALIFSLSILCKFTALLVFPLLLLVPLLVAVDQLKEGPGIRQQLLTVLVSLAKSLLLVIMTVLLTVNIFYGFEGTGTALGKMSLESKSLTALGQSSFGVVPIPLPGAFVKGFDLQKSDSDYSEFPAYFMGKWSVEGFRSYYLAAFIMKETVPFLFLLVIALIMLFRKEGVSQSSADLLLLSYVPLTLILVLSYINKLNVGIRYLLPVYPFLCLYLARMYRSLSPWRGALMALSLLFMVHMVSVLRVSPHFTSYFNELFGGAAKGYRYLIDSNIDWGQDLPSLKKFMSEHDIAQVQLAYFGHGLPEFYGIEYEPLTLPAKPGYVAISVSLLQGHPYLLTYLDPPQFAEAGQFLAMRNLQPIGRAGYSILIYRVN